MYYFPITQLMSPPQKTNEEEEGGEKNPKMRIVGQENK
jgi:hypothetical protein